MNKFWEGLAKLGSILSVPSGLFYYWEQFIALSYSYQVGIIIILVILLFSLLFIIKTIFFERKIKKQYTRKRVPTLKKEVKNPFIKGQVVHHGQFFGREQIIQDLFDLWGDFPNIPLQNAAIYGERRIGKTSLLFHLKDLAETSEDDPRWREGQKLDYLPNMQDYQFIYVSFQNPTYQTQQGFLQCLLQEMELIKNVEDISLSRSKPLIKFGEIVEEYLEKPTIILLDELSVALDRHAKEFNADFWEGLRVICTSLCPQNLAFVLSAHEPPNNLSKKIAGEGGSPFFNVFGQTIELTAFTKYEAQALIHSSPKKFLPEDVEFILQYSKLKPYPLQILCYTCLEYLSKGNHSSEWKKEALKQLDYQGIQHDR